MGKFVKTEHDHVLINFDIECRHMKQLTGLELKQLHEEEVICFNMLLNCSLDLHAFENYLEYYLIKDCSSIKKMELTDDIWYNLIQMCYQNKIIWIDGEMLATELPTTENKRFDDLYDSEEMYAHIRKELRPV